MRETEPQRQHARGGSITHGTTSTATTRSHPDLPRGPTGTANARGATETGSYTLHNVAHRDGKHGRRLRLSHDRTPHNADKSLGRVLASQQTHNHTETETTAEVEDSTSTSEGPKPRQGTTTEHTRSQSERKNRDTGHNQSMVYHR
ncbi:hypothetical protein Taro_041061 [Colocasia esculenta]|uniref:Uncharacterized protein n=1 Tax=Colocasia esculenta TaxID=4460 RepID=A0A843WKI3_COLES|nr:hypothetical protein [Colocasia esculenta]